MPDQRNIYSNPPEPAEPTPSEPPPDPSMMPTGSKVWRKFTASLVLMLALLIGVAVYIYLEEYTDRGGQRLIDADRERKEAEGTNSFDFVADSLASRRARIAEVNALQPSLSLPNSLTEETRFSPTDNLDQERMIRAMRAVRQARDYLAEREYDAAETLAIEALDLWPHMNAGLRLLGVVYWQRGRFDEAITAFESALRDNPFSAEIFNNLAMAHLQLGHYAKAEELLETALNLNPDYYVTSLNLGFLHLAGERYDLAAEYIGAALDEYPNNVNARNNLGVALIRLGRYEEAREHLELLARRVPEVPDPYINLAILCVLEARYDESVEWLRRGSGHCSSAELQRFLADPDLDSLRGYPPFQEFVATIFSDRGSL